MLISGGLAPGILNQIAIGEKITDPQQAQLYKIVVVTAEVAL